MKKFIAILMAVVLVVTGAFVLTGCSGNNENENQTTEAPTGSTEPTKETKTIDNVKVGFIFLHDENSTYDLNFLNGAKEACEKLGVEYLIKKNIPESNDCYDAAAELADSGCNVVFADSFGHESNMKLAAADYPEVQFCHATGTQALVAELDNYHNAFASIYDGRFLAGIAAGMKLNEMIEEGKITAEQAKIGYVGAWPYAEVKSGYTSFFLGARSVCPTATMEVTFTNSWFDIALEKEGALNLINDGCVLISQHADSEGAPKACEEKGVPDVSYNISTIDLGPNTAIVSSKINWEPYFELMINSVAKGEAIPANYCGTLETGSVVLTEINEKVAAEGTAEAIEDAKAKLISGELHVFDTATFTVDPANEANAGVAANIKVDEEGHLTSYLADVEDMGDFAGETEVVKDGVFCESDGRSAPYFDITIDGITLK